MSSKIGWALGLTMVALIPIAVLSWITDTFLDLGIPTWGHALALGVAGAVIFGTLIALRLIGATAHEQTDHTGDEIK